ncbi:restriction endonuclease subunit S [Parabacteroides johnsonii]|uniref:restriction endonuclease subunit S n=1 Tax=Parabacteroides johnsonii TaxID=387661 RepID=UPI00242A7CA3|nr:restriction endonuclease subunit S [Parabacteroides johnsonii]
MATNNNDKTLNVPHLRFPEFSGEWKKCTINDLATVVGGGTPDTTVKSYWGGDIQWFTPSEIGKNKYVDFSLRTITRDGLDNSSAKLLPLHTLLLSSRATVGECSIASNECTTNQGFQSLIAKQCNIDFLYYLIQTKKKDLIRNACGSTFLEISANEIRKIKVAVPVQNEQEQIAKLLSLVDERIATRNKIIEKLESLIRGIYKTLLGESDQYRYLDELCEIKKGVQVNKEELSEKGLYYVMNGGITPSGYYDLYNTEANTISISEGGNSCGYVQYNYTPFWSGGHCYTLENISDVVDDRYLFHYLKANELQIMSLRIGSGLPNIQKKDLSAFRIPLPALNKQINIAKALDALLYKITVDKNIYSTYKQQKEYLLQQMFI